MKLGLATIKGARALVQTRDENPSASLNVQTKTAKMSVHGLGCTHAYRADPVRRARAAGRDCGFGRHGLQARARRNSILLCEDAGRDYRIDRFIGKVGDPQAEAKAAWLKHGMKQAGERRRFVSMLRRTGLAAPHRITHPPIAGGTEARRDRRRARCLTRATVSRGERRGAVTPPNKRCLRQFAKSVAPARASSSRADQA